VRDALEPWCASGATGALRALGPPGGSIYLTEGRITYAECPLACGVNRLLTRSGRMPAEAWRATLAAGRANGRVDTEITRRGRLPAVEIEALYLAATYGAIGFLFDAGTEVRFEMGGQHPMGPVLSLHFLEACAEIERRRAALHDAWPDELVDTSPVTPIRRLDGHLVTLSALQWEIVLNAGRRRTPVDLARILGRDTYATLLAVRRLVRGGLAAPVPETPPGRPAPRPRPARTPATAVPAAPEPEPAATRVPAQRRTPARPAPKPPALPRRTDGDGWRPPDPMPAVSVTMPSFAATEWSEDTLTRILDALQALP
jgi:hypothetical protein